MWSLHEKEEQILERRGFGFFILSLLLVVIAAEFLHQGAVKGRFELQIIGACLLLVAFGVFTVSLVLGKRAENLRREREKNLWGVDEE